MLANQPKNDTLYIKGFNIVVENRAFTYRQVAQNVGQKVCLMPAHYGYLQNNPKVGVFVGAFPENDTVYLINQKAQGGYFDKHIAMFGFLSEQQAVDTYQKCFEYGYIGLMSVIPCTIEQLKWWLANGDKSRPVTKERLPYAGLERLDSVLWGGEDKADLASHSGQVAKLLYQIRQSDNFNHALEPLSYHDLTQELGNQGFVYENYDALVIEYNKLERKAKQLLMTMQGAADIVKPVGVAVSKPLTKGGVANVVAWFEMDDGQAVGVFFHNPDKTPKKIDPTDEMISYKWVLNKKDITIVVAPENGKDLVVRTVAKRIMKLVDANHDRFLKANSAKAELNVKEQDLNAQVTAKQSQLDMLNKDIELLEAQKAEREVNKPIIEQEQVSSDLDNFSFVRDDFNKQKYHLVYNNGEQSQTIFKKGSLWMMNSGESFKTLVEAKQAAIDNAKFWMKMQQEEAESRAEIEGMGKVVKPTIPAIMLGGTSLSDLFKADIGNIWSQSPLYKEAQQNVGDAANAAIAVIGSKDITSFLPYAKTFSGVNDALIAAIDPSVMVSPIIYRRKIKIPKYMVTGDDPKHYIENGQTDFEDFRLSVIDKGDGAYIKTEYKDGYGRWWELKNNAIEDRVFEPVAIKSMEIFNQYKASKTDIFSSDTKPVVPVQPTIEPVAQVVEPTTQDRPSNWRTNLANARAVAKSLGLETKGKKLNTLLKEIDIFDNNEVKKELLAEFKGLASRLVLPKGYVFDLSDAEKSIGDITRSTSAWIKKQGKTDTNSIRVELRTIPDSSQDVIFNSVHFYTDDKKTKTELDKLNYPRYDDIGTSKPTTPKTIVEKMEEFLIKAVFPKIEYLKVVNSTNVDASKLSEIGIAEITDIGDENLYFEKDGKYYISKVGNPQLYALGEWDFAKYPEGKLAAPVTQPEQPASEPQLSSSDTRRLLIKNFSELAKKAGADSVVDGLAQGYAQAYFFDASTKKTSVVVLDISANVLPPSGEAWVFEKHSKIEVSDGKNNVIATFSPTKENILKAFDAANEYISKQGSQPESEPPTSNPDRDYLQSIIDGSMTPKSSDMDVVIALIGKYETDEDMIPLLEQALEKINQTQQAAVKEVM